MFRLKSTKVFILKEIRTLFEASRQKILCCMITVLHAWLYVIWCIHVLGGGLGGKSLYRAFSQWIKTRKKLAACWCAFQKNIIKTHLSWYTSMAAITCLRGCGTVTELGRTMAYIPQQSISSIFILQNFDCAGQDKLFRVKKSKKRWCREQLKVEFARLLTPPTWL